MQIIVQSQSGQDDKEPKIIPLFEVSVWVGLFVFQG